MDCFGRSPTQQYPCATQDAGGEHASGTVVLSWPRYLGQRFQKAEILHLSVFPKQCTISVIYLYDETENYLKHC